MCPTVEDLDLVHQETSNSQRPTHTRPAEHGSRQAIQARPDHSNRMVPPPRGLQSNMLQPQVDLFATRFNNKLPLFVSPVPDPQAYPLDRVLTYKNLIYLLNLQVFGS